ncbi:hypothetical protein QEH59_00915 [Coraliomargarita sp. SDUM461004]|uniref:PEP-CTERM protein-sorting domain-containing protein n=1 Tax=Thalassobacterium sedimentorum TaxID=3041258 RepID=A0ABU1AGR8_9BACT|nr:hypothetical protein [Coraliomargarita sp. SDUM461004]MDQ8192966.1 hypothetical protein [Coraliomargarita sp. SDUM461004]
MLLNKKLHLLQSKSTSKPVTWCKHALLAAIVLAPSNHLLAGPYASSTDSTHAIDGGISSSSDAFVGWAESVEDVYITSSGSGDANNALGEYNSSLLSLGDLDAAAIANGDTPGSITLAFDGFRNGEGWDFAVFENGFTFDGGLFAELAYVEVSSDGINFARFDSISLNTEANGPGFGSAFQGFDMTNVYNLAGKHASGYGTPFDLEQLSDHELAIAGTLDLQNIQYVRLIDIPGDGSYLDSQGNGIIDNWVTTGTGGFDLRAIGYAYAVPEPSMFTLLAGIIIFSIVGTRRR